MRRLRRGIILRRTGMGNIHRNVQPQENPTHCVKKDDFVPVNQFEFLKPFEEDTSNGLCLNGIYLPEEVLQNILSYVPPKKILKLTLVCKSWCNIIKSENFWMNIYNRQYPNKAKKLPWYVFYCYFTTKNFENLLKNGNGQEKFKHWKIVKNFGDEFKIEDPPHGSEPLPEKIPEFNGFTSCFVTSFYECNKIQEIPLENKRLLRYILYKFKPHIYVSEWVAGRFDCGCVYRMSLRGYGEDYTQEAVFESIIDSLSEPSLAPLFHKKSIPYTVQQWEGKKWEKIEILVEEYPPNISMLVFEHEGQDTQFWKGHYGSKMAGGVVRIVFDSIQPLDEGDETKARQLEQISYNDM